jgi:hypothetical protein
MFNVISRAIIVAGLVVVSLNAKATPIISFFIDGNTFYNSFEIENTSTDGESIVSASFDISSLGILFDTADGGAVNNSDGKQFTAVGGSDITTGLVTPVIVADGASFFEMFFSDFDSGESIVWDIDLDFSPGSTGVSGDDLIGALVSIEFNTGDILSGILSAVSGNADASEFVATGLVSAPAAPVATVSEPDAFFMLMLGGCLVLVRRLAK